DKIASQSICDEAILLHQGALAMRGEPEAVLDYYNALIAEKENSTVRQGAAAGGIETVSGSGEATIARVRLLDAKRQAIEIAAVGQAVTLEVDVAVHRDVDQLVVGYLIKDRLGQPVFGTNT